jgi:hypothetical protein
MEPEDLEGHVPAVGGAAGTDRAALIAPAIKRPDSSASQADAEQAHLASA